MKYYMIFLEDGKVVSISNYDTEDARDTAYIYWKDRRYAMGCYYNSVQILNEVE